MKTKENFERVRTARGLKWILPIRDTSGLNAFGWILVAVGGVGTAFMLAWIAGPLGWGVNMLAAKQPFGWALVAFSAFGIGGLHLSLRLLFLGIKVLRNTTRSEIEIVGNQLIAREKIGWFDWRRRIDLDDIRSLQIVDECLSIGGSRNSAASKRRKARGKLPFGLPDIRCLMAEDINGKQTVIALMHSLEFLETLANEISSAIEPLRLGSTSQAVAVAILVASPKDQLTSGSIPVHTSGDGDQLPPTRPASSRIVEHEEADGTIGWEVPAIGFRGGARNLLLFGLFWTGFSGWMLLPILNDLFTNPFDWEELFAAGFTSFFALIGVAILIVAYNWATSRVLIGAVDGQLLIEKSSMHRTKLIDFQVSEISYIDVGDSSMEVNDEPIPELKIFLSNGVQHGMLGGHEEAELEWFAFRLNEQLNLKTPMPDGQLWRKELGCHDNDQLSKIRMPVHSRVVVSHKGGQSLGIEIPRIGIVKMLPKTIASAIIAPLPLLIYFFAINEPVLVLLGIVFLLMAIGINLGMLAYYVRSFSIETDGIDLTITRQGLRGSKAFRWHRGAIKSIDLRGSGTYVNGKTLHQLFVDADPQLSLMTGWDKQEIAVAAGVLNQALDLNDDVENAPFA